MPKKASILNVVRERIMEMATDKRGLFGEMKYFGKKAHNVKERALWSQICSSLEDVTFSKKYLWPLWMLFRFQTNSLELQVPFWSLHDD